IEPADNTIEKHQGVADQTNHRDKPWNESVPEQHPGKETSTQPEQQCRNFGQAKEFRLLEDVAKSLQPRALGGTSLEELLAQRDQQQGSDDADHHDGALDDPGSQVPDRQGFIEFSEQAKRKHRDKDNPNVVERPQQGIQFDCSLDANLVKSRLVIILNRCVCCTHSAPRVFSSSSSWMKPSCPSHGQEGSHSTRLNEQGSRHW